MTALQLDYMAVITMLLASQFNQFSIYFTICLPSPYFISMSVRRFCETALKALLKLRKTSTDHLFASTKSVISCRRLSCDSGI